MIHFVSLFDFSSKYDSRLIIDGLLRCENKEELRFSDFGIGVYGHLYTQIDWLNWHTLSII